jgi:hypothetical protein
MTEKPSITPAENDSHACGKCGATFYVASNLAVHDCRPRPVATAAFLSPREIVNVDRATGPPRTDRWPGDAIHDAYPDGIGAPGRSHWRRAP